MRFGQILEKSKYEPWSSDYIDYARLKHLLREDQLEDDAAWTDADEGSFVEELINLQLEKVSVFQASTYASLGDKAAKCQERLEAFVPEIAPTDTAGRNAKGLAESQTKELSIIQRYLDSISKEISELERYSRINFTGFLKAAKKHDRKRGHNYRVRPLLEVRLASLPFNTEDYSSLLYRLSAMYSFVRQRLSEDEQQRPLVLSTRDHGGSYKSYKFWIHIDNILEVKTYILRHLPVLVYNSARANLAETGNADPTITSLYFDNSKFSLYSHQVDREIPASSLRLRWHGHLRQKTDIFLEKKTINEDETSDEVRFPVKAKYIKAFIEADYHMEKSIRKLQQKHQDEADIRAQQLQTSVEEVQNFIVDNGLQPVLRANYKRVAFQIPGDDRVRISIDSNLAFIREDCLDRDRPCRSPDAWHREDIDSASMTYPFTDIRKGERATFPHAVLEIKIKDEPHRQPNEWITELMSSHLIKEAPRFSKFVHGTAELFEDYVNTFPFWFSNVHTDIRRDPEIAFEEEQDRKAQRADDEVAIGSFIGSKSVPNFEPAVASPGNKSSDVGVSIDTFRETPTKLSSATQRSTANSIPSYENPEMGSTASWPSIIPSLTTLTRVGRDKRASLPRGIHEPAVWIKNVGPVKVEPKVWLANQRTFVKWCHVSILLASLSMALYNAAGENNSVARTLGIVYTVFAIFAAGWGWWTFLERSEMIAERSGKDFDNTVGPVVVCIGLSVALCLNFGLKL